MFIKIQFQPIKEYYSFSHFILYSTFNRTFSLPSLWLMMKEWTIELNRIVVHESYSYLSGKRNDEDDNDNDNDDKCDNHRLKSNQ